LFAQKEPTFRGEESSTGKSESEGSRETEGSKKRCKNRQLINLTQKAEMRKGTGSRTGTP
jgi:hypothetical protein